MTRNLPLVSFLSIFISACAMMNNNLPEVSETAETQATTVPVSAKQSQLSTAGGPTCAEPGNQIAKTTSPVNKNLTKEQIQLVQDMLKSAGQYRGPIDGVVGPKTKAALQQYQSGCLIVSSLLGGSGGEIPRQTVEKQSPTATAAGNKDSAREQVRLIQERLKESGFDPGPIDGKMGPRTRAALQRYQASQGLSDSGSLDDKTLVALGAR